uniref:Reverse transcriptase domain-containing protein n=1 Tax=Tanacetum cinerariifolium TaxID=118510 RepID=A0A6L2K8F6_TANCI|nr:hypothetical protein [Tanacetum cinerariifolium]
MADNPTMEELLQAPTKGYGEAIVIPEINANHFEIKTNLLQLVQANPYHGFERENPHTHINNFKRITSTLNFRDVPNDVIKLMTFSYSLEGNARVLNDQNLHKKATNQMEKFFQIFQDLHFDISVADALLLMPKVASTIKSLLTNKDKLFELAKIPLNENCSAMLLKNLFEKLGDLGKFLIPCDFLGMDVCHALADLGKLHFSTDFVVVDFEADPRVPLILGRSFLRTDRSLIDVYGEEITLPVNDEAVTFNLNQTTRYSSTYDDFLVNQIDIIDVARRGSVSPEIDHADCDPEGGICLIEKLLNDDPVQLLPIDLKQGEAVKAKSSIEEPPKLELKELPSYLKYAYLEGVDKLPEIISKDLKVDEKEALLKLLKSHKRAIAWKITDIKGIDPRFCTHKSCWRRIISSLCKVKDGLTQKFMSPWVSPILCVPKKGGITVVENENNELIPAQLVTG